MMEWLLALGALSTGAIFGIGLAVVAMIVGERIVRLIRRGRRL